MNERGRQPVRVLIVHPRDPAAPTLGGIQTFLHDFVKHCPADFEITVAGVTADARRRPIGTRQEIAVEGRRAWTLPLAPVGRLGRSPTALLRVLVAQLRLRRMMLDRHTILQVHRPFRPVLLAGHRGPRVQFIHLDIRAWPGPSGWARLGRLYRPFSDQALNAMDRVYVVNEPGAAMLREAHPSLAERIEFLPVWFDEDVFQPAQPAQRERLRHELAARLGLAAAPPATERYILWAGRLEPGKDPLLAIEAWAQLDQQATETRLLIAGEGELRPALAARAAELGCADRIHLLGQVGRSELADIMRAADVLLLSSVAEGGGPRVVVEALACGLPVVATDVGDIGRTVTSGANGWLTDEHAPAELAEGLRWAFSRPAPDLARAAVAAVAPYTARRVLEPLYRAYRDLVS